MIGYIMDEIKIRSHLRLYRNLQYYRFVYMTFNLNLLFNYIKHPSNHSINYMVFIFIFYYIQKFKK